jgi:protease-4
MKTMFRATVIASGLLLLGGCAAHFHLDFLGSENLEEVSLVPSTAKDKILVLDIEGLISSLAIPGMLSREGDILSQVYARLEKASADPLVRGIILRLDTPGGEVTASDIVYHELIKFREKTGRPVVGLMMSTAASGGYYIAQACDHVIAHSSTITGSIGVISIFPSTEGLLSKIGVKVNVIKSGEMKDAGSTFLEMTSEDRKVFQGIIDELYQNFLDVISKNRERSLSKEELRAVADGRVYTAPQALRLKLIDEIGYFDSALKKVLALASLKQAKVIAYSYYPKRRTNLYAASLAAPSLFENRTLDKYLPSLKAGFYYLWIPEAR